VFPGSDAGHEVSRTLTSEALATTPISPPHRAALRAFGLVAALFSQRGPTDWTGHCAPT